MPPITIYSTPTCPYCIRAKKLLLSKGLKFEDIDVAGRPEVRRAMSEKAAGQTTVPQIWIGEVHIGGSDELHALDASGKLAELINGKACQAPAGSLTQ